MITLYNFGSMFGLVDPSPFVSKAHLLLKLANLPYQTNTKGFSKAPKKKLPYLLDEGKIIADSSFIRFHLEQKYSVDFDAALNAEQKAISWAVEKMLEEHLYFIIMRDRWLDDANFDAGPKHFFDDAPAPLRPLIRMIVRRGVRKTLFEQGLGRHNQAEIEQLAALDIAAVAATLGDKPFLMGDRPCAADASVYGFISSVLCKTFKSATRNVAESYPNLSAYIARIDAQYFAAEQNR